MEGDTVFKWVEAEGGSIPEDAVVGGHDQSEPIYVARATHENDLIPGKLVPSHGVAYVSYAGEEHTKPIYEVLVAPATAVGWEAATDGEVPVTAIPGGKTEDGETLFIGRADNEGSLTIGKIHPSHGCLYIPHGGQEHGVNSYEVLVKK